MSNEATLLLSAVQDVYSVTATVQPVQTRGLLQRDVPACCVEAAQKELRAEK